MKGACDKTPIETEETFFDGKVTGIDFINIETTRYCNLECRMCLQFNDGTTVTGPHMDMELFRKVAEEVFPLVSRFQPSVSGEPLMSRGFKEMLEISLKHGVRMEICTNATLFTPKFIDLLSKVAGKILISFDGASKEVFEYIRGGTEFEQVVENVKKLCAKINLQSPSNRPVVGLACVLMEKNIRELPQLVRLARDLGTHFLACSHVHPVTAEMRAQSLANYPELAKEKIQEALHWAEKLKFPLICNPLDQLIAATALTGKGREKRRLTSKDGVFEGLGYVSWGEDLIPAWPEDLPESDFSTSIRPNRKRVSRKNSLAKNEPNTRINADSAELPSSLWFCDFLWNKSYIALDGSVRPCCVPGTPNLGNVKEKPFMEIWNSEEYRKMRLRLAQKKPLPFCRGCQHIREVDDPSLIAHILENRPLKEEEEPSWEEQGLPTLHWEEAKDVLGYELQGSFDSFRNIMYSTGREPQDLLQENRFQITKELWDATPKDQIIWWRVWAHREGESWVVGQGQLIKEVS